MFVSCRFPANQLSLRLFCYCSSLLVVAGRRFATLHHLMDFEKGHRLSRCATMSASPYSILRLTLLLSERGLQKETQSNRMDVSTSMFMACASEAVPYKFEHGHAQLRQAVRITHLVSNSSSGQAAALVPTFVLVKTLSGPSKTVESFTVAAFPPSHASPDSTGLVTSADIIPNLDLQFDVDEYTEIQVIGPMEVTVLGELFTELVDDDIPRDPMAALAKRAAAAAARRRRRGDEDEVVDSDDEEAWMDEMFTLARD